MSSRPRRARLRRGIDFIDLDKGLAEIAAIRRAHEREEIIKALVSTIAKPGRPRVRDPLRPFAHYAAGRRQRCHAKGCRKFLRRDQPAACSKECIRKIVEWSYRMVALLEFNTIERRSDVDADLERFIDERTAAYEQHGR